MPSNPPADRCPLLDLPGELVDAILAYLTPLELTTLSAACRTFHRRALSDSVWASIAKANIPGPPLASPYPFNTYHDLYKSLETKWFLTKHKLWFCDRDLVGRMIICRWNQRTGGLEGFQLVAVSNHTKFHSWGAKSGVVIHMFEPKVALHTEKPVIKFIAGEQPRARRGELPLGTGFQAEVPMVLEENPRALQCNFMLARPLEKEAMAHIRYQNFPYRCVWPPPSVPASHRVAGAPGFTGSRGLMKEDIPTCRSEASSHAFRIRQWIEMSNNPASPDSMLGQGLFSLMEALTGNGPSPTIPMRAATMRARVEEEIITYSTLDPVLYTPTELKPWRGIWVGDYSGHGCEFLLITQSDDPEISDEELGLVQREYESEQDWQRRRYEARLYRGRLEAVKLTGDPNVPRGEFTFVADDLGENGFVGIAQEDPFRGARVVKSRGHIAREGFRGSKCCPMESNWFILLTFEPLQTNTSSRGYCWCLRTGLHSIGLGLDISASLRGLILTSSLIRSCINGDMVRETSLTRDMKNSCSRSNIANRPVAATEVPETSTCHETSNHDKTKHETTCEKGRNTHCAFVTFLALLCHVVIRI